MAFREKLDWSDLHQYRGGSFPLDNGHFNVDMAVGGVEHGSGFPAPNRPPDMQLVFYFLWRIYLDGDKLMFPARPSDDLTVTPKQRNYHSKEMGKKLSNLIYRFQTDLLNANKLVYRDGRCDKGKSKISSISQTRYTIHHLNFHYANTIKGKYHQDDWQTYLITDPYLPEEARNEILMKESFLGVAV